MSRFFDPRYSGLAPYVPGEQPRDMVYIKLNTNESPFPPSPRAVAAAAEAAGRLQLYSDPEALALRREFARIFGLEADRVVFSNGSDEILYWIFLAFCADGAAFPALSYGFYPVYGEFTGTPCTQIPLREDYSVAPEDYYHLGKTVILANPNAPTGLALSAAQIEEILRTNPDNVVAVDEAYVDFGAESCLPLIDRYDNLLVVQTFSKSRSMAGARLGFAAGSRELIEDLNRVKYSTNPYNVNSMTMAAGIAALADEEYTRKNCRIIAENRDYTIAQLRAMGFFATDSLANFVFARHPAVSGRTLYEKLRERGVLVRHFSREDIGDFNRITVGTREQMDILLEKTREILEETK